ncbi:MAG: SPOR domain-containing protein [Planctomycetota bacterium]|jgi:tetratricopeptide (TPR) repeat protein
MKRSCYLAAVGLMAFALGCVSRDPRFIVQPTNLYREAESLYLQGRFAEARGKFREVLRSSMLSDRKWVFEARYYMARCDHMTGNLSEAVRAYNELLKIPRYPSLEIRMRAARADISLETGNYNGAAGDYGRALTLYERYAGSLGKSTEVDREKLLFGRGKAMHSLERYKDSDQLFDRYLADFPDGRFVKEARALHTKLGGGARPKVTFYTLVGGLYRLKSQANHLAGKLRLKGFADVVVEKRPSASGFVYTVRIGHFETRREAHAQKQELETAGFRPVYVRP